MEKDQKKLSVKIRLLALAVAALLVGIDQLLKHWVYVSLRPGSVSVIPGLLNLTYVENRGAAFGIFQGHTMVLSIVVLIFLVLILAYLLSGRVQEKGLLWILSIILAGGAGNLVDRLTRGFVIDYLDITPLFSFPVFNFADCCVVCGAIALVIYMVVTDVKRIRTKKASESESE
ncbi:MAG: signal peptidase II [Oscillospiraceae bacterium]